MPKGIKIKLLELNKDQNYESDLSKFRNEDIYVENIITIKELSQIPDESIDAVISSLMLCQIKNLKSFSSNCYRILVPVSFYYI